MEMFIWQKNAICAEHHRFFPRENNQVTVKMPLFFPQVIPEAVCSCQNDNCPILRNGACSGRAVFLEAFPAEDKIAGIIIPELRFVSYKLLSVRSNLSAT